MAEYEIGQKVEWQWGRGTARADVVEVYKERVTKTIKGSEITRNATEENPAYLLKQDDGSLVLKSHSELRQA